MAAGRVSATSPMGAGEPLPADDAPTMPAVVICATAPKVKSVFEAIRERERQRKPGTRIVYSKVFLFRQMVHLTFRRAYNGRVRKFNPSDRTVLT